jgi:hypothetical protein
MSKYSTVPEATDIKDERIREMVKELKLKPPEPAEFTVVRRK